MDKRTVFQKILSQLKWEPVFIKSDGITPIQIALPREKMHLFFVPPAERVTVLTELELIHCLVHALMAEQIHILFGYALTERKIQTEKLITANLVCGMVADWFVFKKSFELAPGETKELILFYYLQTLEFINNGMLSLDDPYTCVYAGLLTALVVEIFKKEVPVIDDRLDKVIETFLSVPPSEPTLANFATLANRLFAYTGDGMEVSQAGVISVSNENGIMTDGNIHVLH